MKKVLFSIFIIIHSVSIAQFVVEENDFPIVGDTVLYAIDSSFTDNLNNLDLVGDSLEWDFSELGVGREDTLLFVPPTSLQSGNIFASSDFGYRQNNFNFFMTVNQNSIKTIGMSTSISSIIDTTLLQDTTLFDSSLASSIPENAAFRYFNGGLYYLDLPAELGDHDDGTAEGAFSFFYGDTFQLDTVNLYIDSFRVKETVNYVSDVDGFGVLKLPYGDFYAIRQLVTYSRSYTIEAYFDALQVIPNSPITFYSWVATPFGGFNVNEKTYRFHAKDQVFPLVEINTDSAGTFNISKFQTRPSGSQVGINEYQTKKMYHISANNDLIFIQGDKKIMKVEIIDMSGKVIESVTEMKNTTYIPFYHKGIYIVKVYDSENHIQVVKIINY